MGILRIYLALCVVATHAGRVFPWRMHGGGEAVQIFYIISGFYMAMVLSSPRYKQTGDFYLSRALRIFPLYWVVLAGTVITCAISGILFHHWLMLSAYFDAPFSHNGKAGVLVAGLSNFTLLGQDWVMFLTQEVGRSLRLTVNFHKDSYPLWHYLIVPQAWSIGVELCFYLIVPLLHRLKSRWLLLLSCATFVLRWICYKHTNLRGDPWTNRFVPFELGIFILGMLGYRMFANVRGRGQLLKYRCTSPAAYLAALIGLLGCFYLVLRAQYVLSHIVGGNVATVSSYFGWALAIPALFAVFGSNPIDRVIGELSYPIYLTHYLIASIVSLGLDRFDFLNGWHGAVTAVISIGVSIVLYRQLVLPLERKRHEMTVSRPNEKRDFSGNLSLEKSSGLKT